MGTTDHNRILGIIHIAYGAVTLVVLALVSVLIFPILGLAALDQGGSEALGIGIIGLIVLFVIGLNIVLTIPEFVAGYGLLKRKRWAKAASIVSAILETLSFPFGTALAVYTFWFIFSDQGRRIYDRSGYALPPSPPQWAAGPIGNGEAQYVPPLSPPNWR